jgi:vacuolar-type H+-ATPase subunit E/Vma4
MATLTIAIDPAILEAARLEAERRKTSLDQIVADYLATVANVPSERKPDNSALVRLMEKGVLGDLGTLPTREEIYAERTRWPRS